MAVLPGPDPSPDASALLPAGRRRPTIPRHRTPPLGRERELAALQALLARDEVGLLTLTGTGGSGKTRLALELAARLQDAFPDGCVMVPLQAIADPDLVAEVIARSLNIQEAAGRPIAEVLVAHLERARLLLVLDNFEHLLAAAPLAAELLLRCAGPKLLVTSRAPLRVSGEYEFPVLPLPIPEDPRRNEDEERAREAPGPEAVLRFASVELFCQRTAAVRPTFVLTAEHAPAVAAICIRLDGLPLALELAAARMKALSPQALLARLERRLAVLTGGGRDRPERQRTLRATIAWSYDLLTPAERAIFRRLGVFAGGCTLDVAEAVCGDRSRDPAPAGGRRSQPTAVGEASSAFGVIGAGEGGVLDGLASLVDNSLLRRDDKADGEVRFWMLETLREFAQERLEDAGEADAIRRRHAQAFLALAERAAARLKGAQQLRWLRRLDGEHDNLRAALAWALERGESEVGLRLAGALEWYWQLRGYLTEGRRWLEAALALPGARAPTAARAAALFGAGDLARFQGDDAAARPRLEESAAIRRTLGDPAGVGHALHWLGRIEEDGGAPAAAHTRFAESIALFRLAGDRWGLALALASDSRHAGTPDGERSLLEESLALTVRLGDRWNHIRALLNLAQMERRHGDLARAAALNAEGLALSRELGNKRFIANALIHLGDVLRRLGDGERSWTLLRESLPLSLDLGHKPYLVHGLRAAARAAAAEGRPLRAVRLFGAAAAIPETSDARLPPADADEAARAVAPLRARLGDAAYAAAWAAGRELSPTQAVAEALAGTEGDGGARERPDGLTAREVDVLCLLASGCSNREIAARLVISVRTVVHHLEHVYRKIDARNRAEAATYALRHGLLDADAP